MAHNKLTIKQINHLTESEFVSIFGRVFENSPHIARAAWLKRPFSGGAALHQAMVSVVSDLFSEYDKERLICAHPDLVGKAARAGTLSPESTQEQASAGLDRLSDVEIRLFRDLNERYLAKFGFPFVICVRENKKEAILAGMESRLENNRAYEIGTALQEIGKIARLRITDLVEDDRLGKD